MVQYYHTIKGSIHTLQMYARLNQLNMSVSYCMTLRLMDQLGKRHTVPLQKWIKDKVVFKFVGDNVEKQQRVRDYRSDHHGKLLHMFSLLVSRSRTPAPELQHTGHLSKLTEIAVEDFLPTSSDVRIMKGNLVVLVSRILVQYFPSLAFLSKAVTKHILHKYSSMMAQKSEVVVLDVLMKNETVHKDMLEIMDAMQGYLGDEYPLDRRVTAGGDHVTCERMIGAQKHLMDGDTRKERLGILEPVAEDFHFLMCIIVVRYPKMNT